MPQFKKLRIDLLLCNTLKIAISKSYKYFFIFFYVFLLVISPFFNLTQKYYFLYINVIKPFRIVLNMFVVIRIAFLPSVSKVL